ncbi:hypothetical protein TruAng_004538 [Truncatella angustata]|nr:hypothetical protein TruAng_004538 [Truncatella angustata]
MSDLDLSLFSYFRFVSGMEFALFFDDPTWERRALQIAHSEPTILHAVLAISALSRHQNSGGKFWNDSSQPCSVLEYSTKQYNLAIQCLTSRLGKPAEHTNILIIGSLLFIHIEFMRGSQESVFLHLHGASALLKSLKEYSYETEYLEAALAYIEAQLHGLLSYEATKTCQSMIRQPDPASFIYPASVAKALDQQDHFTVIDVPDIFRRETYSRGPNDIHKSLEQGFNDERRVGSQALKSGVRKLLEDTFKKEFPNVKSNVTYRLSRFRFLRDSLGLSRSSPHAQRAYLGNACKRFEDFCRGAPNADYTREA